MLSVQSSLTVPRVTARAAGHASSKTNGRPRSEDRGTKHERASKCGTSGGHMPRRDTTHITRTHINFTNEEVAILRAFEQVPNTATKAEIRARAKRILDETKETAQKKFP